MTSSRHPCPPQLSENQTAYVTPCAWLPGLLTAACLPTFSTRKPEV
jgi:hypothetical protein